MIFDTFQCKTNPFAENIPHGNVHHDARFTSALEQFQLFPELGDIALLSARTGLGKTTLLMALTEVWKSPYDVHYLHLGSLKGSGLFRAILNQLGERPRLGKDRLFAQVFAQLAKRGRPQCLLIDEAQLMDIPTMTDLRLLCGDPEMAGRLKLLLSGQPILEKTLQAESLTDLRERLCLKVQLRPLDMVESIDYMDHRLKMAGSKLSIFEEDALQLIVNATKGVPRKINGLAFRSMLSAAHKKLPKIDSNTVREVYASELP
jgi:general secretion pathway protein A